MQSMLRRKCHCGLLDGASQLLNALGNCLLTVYHRIPQPVFKASLESGPVHLHEARMAQWVLKRCLTHDVNQDQ